MGAIREWIQDRPAVGYGVVGLIVVVAIGIAMTRLARPTEVEELGQFITLKDSETGETWKVPLGAIERNLHGRELPIDPKEGMPNPNTGKRNGFPEKDWEKIIARVVAERKASSSD